MNNVTVGDGESERNTVIPPRPGTETIRADTAIRNQNLDEWWVTHIENNQKTDLYVDFQIVLEADVPGSPKIPIDSDALDYRTTIETDIFGNKDNGTSTDGTSSTEDEGTETGDETDGTATADGTATPTPSDGILTPDETSTPAPDDDTATSGDGTATPDDGGLLPT